MPYFFRPAAISFGAASGAFDTASLISCVLLTFFFAITVLSSRLLRTPITNSDYSCGAVSGVVADTVRNKRMTSPAITYESFLPLLRPVSRPNGFLVALVEVGGVYHVDGYVDCLAVIIRSFAAAARTGAATKNSERPSPTTRTSTTKSGRHGTSKAAGAWHSSLPDETAAPKCR